LGGGWVAWGWDVRLRYWFRALGLGFRGSGLGWVQIIGFGVWGLGLGFTVKVKV